MDVIFKILAWLHNLPGVDAEMGEIFDEIAKKLNPEG